MNADLVLSCSIVNFLFDWSWTLYFMVIFERGKKDVRVCVILDGDRISLIILTTRHLVFWYYGHIYLGVSKRSSGRERTEKVSSESSNYMGKVKTQGFFVL